MHKAIRATAPLAALTFTGAPASGADATANPFAGDLGNAAVTLIIFGLVVFVLGKYVWPPLMKLLDERERTIREALEDARRERGEAEALLRQYAEQIERARTESAEIVEQGKRNASEAARRIQEEAQREAQATVERGLREIRLATDSAKQEVYDIAAQLAVDVAGRIIARELSPRDHEDLVAQSLERMRESDAKLN